MLYTCDILETKVNTMDSPSKGGNNNMFAFVLRVAPGSYPRRLGTLQLRIMSNDIHVASAYVSLFYSLSAFTGHG